jgi:signal transduction histidine kinase
MRRRWLFAIFLLTLFTSAVKAATDDKKDAEYQTLRDSMRHAFNDGDSARFFVAVKKLEDYLQTKNDLHGYYTQKCNEIVFLMNQQKIFEAYKLARELSSELREKKLDKEMYMAYNMLGHINRYCGNKEAAKRNFYQVVSMMEKAGYYESIPPIYMNIVNVALDDDHEEAIRLLDKAMEIAKKYSPDRVFDIETRKSLSYFNSGDIPKFLEGYRRYREGVAEGKSSVHGRSMEVYYLACTGHTDEAVELAREELGDDGRDAITIIYERAGRWKDAFLSLREQTQAKDSIANVVLTNSMQGIRDELSLYDVEKRTTRNRMIALAAGVLLLALLVAALIYIIIARRKHMRELKVAYEMALESDRMKSAFIQNISHELRTPLNVISGFTQVIANPELEVKAEERKEMAKTIQKNTLLVTTLIDEMIQLSLNESSGVIEKKDEVEVDDLIRDLLQENQIRTNQDTQLLYETTLSQGFTFQTNEDMLKRIINTLLDNALKNTEQGTVTLRTSADEHSLQMVVEDTGCGIPAGEEAHIFDHFVKLDDFKEGLGLGLPLSRMLARRLGGDVVLDTQYKKQGARFVVTLPLTSRPS